MTSTLETYGLPLRLVLTSERRKGAGIHAQNAHTEVVLELCFARENDTAAVAGCPAVRVVVIIPPRDQSAAALQMPSRSMWLLELQD